jgi:hypothetical protein
MAIFGKPPIDPTALASEIIYRVRHEKRDDRTNWNKTVKDVLRDRVDGKRCLVHPDSKESYGEWLLDVVWFTREEGTILLAAEIEWGRKGEVLVDFQKLLCIKAPLKVMVYCDRSGRGSFVKDFEEYLREFDHHVAGEHYLFIEMAPGPSDRAYLYKVPSDGHQTGISFQSLSVRRAKAA